MYTFYDEKPKSLLDETDIEKTFDHNILDIALFDNGIVRDSECFNQEIFAFKIFQFCILKYQQRFILQEEVSVS